MRIEINDHRRIFTIQREFNGMFPYLQLEFFAKPHIAGGEPSKEIVKHPAKSLGTCRTNHKKGVVEITPSMTVRELGEIFSDVFGLSILITRKSGNEWIETSDSDGWTLKDQNEKGGVSLVDPEHELIRK